MRGGVGFQTYPFKFQLFLVSGHNPYFLDKTAVNQLMEKVDEAIKLLFDYTTRVEAELKEREEIEELLDAYIWQQKHLLKDTKKKMKVCPTLICVSSLSMVCCVCVCVCMCVCVCVYLGSPEQVREGNSGASGAAVPSCQPA